MIDDIQAEGLTPLQLKEVIVKKIRNYIDEPTVSVIVVEANSFRVFVTGQVRMPGMYKLRSETSLLQIIPIAGGFTEWADQKRIMIIRKEKGVEKRITASYKKILDTSESSDVVLKSGDTVVVP
jgi:polysaccharide export outer membrane protein